MKTKVKSYTRSVNGKKRKVRSYSRTHRKTGRKYRYKKVGTMYAKFDQYGNLHGSRITKIKKKSTSKA